MKRFIAAFFVSSALVAAPASAHDQDPPPPGQIKIFKGFNEYGWTAVCPPTIPAVLCDSITGKTGEEEVIGFLQTNCDYTVVQNGRIYPATSYDLLTVEQC